MATKYVAQSAAGANDGSSAGNAYSIAQLNAASPYSPVGDDIIILNGTMTSTLTPPTSGTAGHPITYQFAASAKFSKALWGTVSTAAIYVNAKNYITIDGNNVGIVENTANGDGMANQTPSDLIYSVSTTGSVIQNLTVQNAYVHIFNTNNSAGISSNAITFDDCNSLDVHNCIIHDARYGIFPRGVSNGAYSTWNCYNNTISACSTAIFFGVTGAAQSANSITFTGNDVNIGLNWYDTPDQNHIDGFHSLTSGGSLTNVLVEFNYFHGDPSAHSTACVYLTDGVASSIVRNNLIIQTTNNSTSAIYYNTTGAISAVVENNTIVGANTTDGHGFQSDHAMTLTFKNNIIQGLKYGYYDAGSNVTLTSDYNVFFGIGNSVGIIGGSFYTTLANFQAATSGDAHSTSSTPNLSVSGVPVATSSAIGAGVNLSGSFTTGLSSSATFPAPATTTRGATWDIGAYVVTSGGSTYTSSFAGKISFAGKVTLK